MMSGGERTTFGKYFLLKKIASGGMGEIFLAKLKGPVGFEKLLVIKRILQQHTENQDFVDMFFAEARVAAQLSHSNVVQIYEMGQIDDSFFIAMEYVHGKSFRNVIDRTRELATTIPPAHVIELMSELAAGLSYSHNALDMAGNPLGVVHRDINPQNVIISYQGEVKVIDFGIAKSQMSMHKTETGTIKGKFVYMSPEQSAADKLDKRSDIFSLGICLYEALTTRNPFAKANVVLSLDAIQRQRPRLLREMKPELACFQPILDLALAKSPDDRYADCADMRADLLGMLASGIVEKPAQSLAEFMQELFAEQIEHERRSILETDKASTIQLEKMRAYQNRELRSGGVETESTQDMTPSLNEEEWDEESQEYEISTVVESRSWLSMALFLGSLILALTTGAVALRKYLPDLDRRSNKPSSVVREITDPTTIVQPPRRGIGVKGKRSVTKKREELVRQAAAPATKGVGAPRPERPSGAGSKGRTKSRSEGRRRPKTAPRPPGHESEPASSVQPAPPPPVSPPRPPPPEEFGTLIVSLHPPVEIRLDGAASGQTLTLRSPSGTLEVGGGSDAETDPFRITIHYAVDEGSVVYRADSRPWAVLYGTGGVGLGRTPQTVKSSGITILEFKYPKDKRTQRVTLRFSPPRA